MARMRLKIPFSLILILVSTTTTTVWAELKFDQKFEAACNDTGGVFQRRSDEQDIKGDKCAMPFSVATRDDDDAREFCELYAPWRLEKASRTVSGGRPVTTCHVEATLTCDGGWIQMFGRCFQRPNKDIVATYKEAESICTTARKDAKIAFMHHRYIVGVWKRYFKGISQIWVRATETWDQYIQDAGAANGSALALAFTGKHYDFSVPHNSLIKINPDIRLQILCEYEPPMTPAEINYLGRRYSEIYYPTVPVDNGILVRTASSYTRNSSNLEVCKKALKPFKVEVVGPFVPEKEILEQIAKHRSPHVLLTRSGAETRVDKEKLEQKDCQQVKPRFEVKVPDLKIGDYVMDNVPKDEITCDNMLSAAITHFNDQEAKLKVMSDSRSLPMWCKLGHPVKFTYETPEGYTAFERVNGEVIGHKLYIERVTYEEAKKKCQDVGAHVSGINSIKEVHALGALAIAAGEHHLSYWLGGVRRKNCYNTNGFVDGENHECSRNKVIEWENDVAQLFRTEWWRDGSEGHKNPSSTPGHQQNCLVYVHGTPSWASKDTETVLDDVECDSKRGFFCSVKIDIKKVDS